MDEAFGVMKMRVDPNTNAEAYSQSLTFWQTIEGKYQERKRKLVEDNARLIAAKLTAIRAKKQLDEAIRAKKQLDEAIRAKKRLDEAIRIKKRIEEAIRAKQQLDEARKLIVTNSDSAIASGSLGAQNSDAQDGELSDFDPDMLNDPDIYRRYSDSAISIGSLGARNGDAQDGELSDFDPDIYRRYSDAAIVSRSLDSHYGDAKDDEFSDVEPDMFKDPGDRYYSSLDATMWENIRNGIMNIHIRAMNVPVERRRMVLRGFVLSLFLFVWIIIGVFYLFQKVEPEPIQGTYNTGSGCRLDWVESSIIDDIIKAIFPAGHVDDEM